MNYTKAQLKDSQGRPLTQSLFLEIGYSDSAIFTLKEDDYEYKGKLYQSLKRLYLDFEDVTEYEFAIKYLIGWQHWQRLAANKAIAKYINVWREELELKIRAQAIRDIMDMTAEEKSFQAAKWLSDRGWEKRAPGRPSKLDKQRDDKMQERLDNEFSADIIRMNTRK